MSRVHPAYLFALLKRVKIDGTYKSPLAWLCNCAKWNTAYLMCSSLFCLMNATFVCACSLFICSHHVQQQRRWCLSCLYSSAAGALQLFPVASRKSWPAATSRQDERATPPPRHPPSLFNALGFLSSWKENAWRGFDTYDYTQRGIDVPWGASWRPLLKGQRQRSGELLS